MKATKTPAKAAATASVALTQAARIAALEGAVKSLMGSLSAVRGRATKDRNTMTEARKVIDAQSAVMADQRRNHTNLESDVKKLMDAVWGKKTPTPETPVPSVPAPPATPSDPATPMRTRADVVRIIVEEFKKQTPVLPGGGDITDPNKAIGQWATHWIDAKGALHLPEDLLRTLLAVQVDADVRAYSWERKPGSEPPVVLIDGNAEIKAS